MRVMMNKVVVFGLLLLACFSLAFAEEQGVELTFTENVLAVKPACTREVNETFLTGYEENIIKDGYYEQLFDDNGSPYEVYRAPVINRIPIYENETSIERWDCDGTIDYELEASWVNESHIHLNIKDLRIQEDYKLNNLELAEGIKDLYLPARIYDLNNDSFEELGLAVIRNSTSKFSYNQVVSKEDILGKEYHIGESSAVYIVTSGTEHNMSNGIVRVTWNTASDEGELCWYNTTYNCMKLEFVGYSSSTASSGGSYTKSWLEIVSSTDKANISLSAGFYPQIKFTGTGSIKLTGDADFTADYASIKNISSYGSGNNDINSDPATAGLVLWDESAAIAIMLQPSQVDSGNWRADFDSDVYEIDYATGENVNLIVFDGIDVNTNTDQYSSSQQSTPDQLMFDSDDFVGASDFKDTSFWSFTPSSGTFENNVLNFSASSTLSSIPRYNLSKVVSNGGKIAFKSRQLFNSSDLNAGGLLQGFYKDGSNHAIFYSQADDTIDFRVNGTSICADVANGITITNYNTYEVRAENGNITAFINDAQKCNTQMYSVESHYLIVSSYGVQDNKGYVTVDYINYSFEVLPNTLDIENSASFWNVTQTASFAESWGNASLREADISRSYNDTTKKYTDSYTYTNITNDFTSFPGTDVIPYFAYAPVNATNINTTMLYWIPSEWGNYPTTLNSNILSTITYSISTTPDIIINAPLNQSYTVTPSRLNFTLIGGVSYYNCTYNLNNNATSLTNIPNNTLQSHGIVSQLGENNLNISCYEGFPYYHNQTNSTIYTVDDINFTFTQNATAYEGITNLYTVDIGLNTELISYVNASLYWNDTFIGFNENAITSPSNTRVNMTFMIPITETNNTSINTYWNVTKQYINGSTFYENSSNSAQAVIFAWNWSATSYNSQIIERNYNDLSINVSKLGGVGDGTNATITALLNYNGSPSTMPLTMNTSTKLGYSNTTRLPRMPVEYNWTMGFNVTLNYSLNHGILGYNSRIDNITHTNYTQTLHIAWLGNCTVIDKPHLQALDFYMYDEESEGAVTENFQAERINILLDDGTSRNYSLTEMTGYTNYTICIYPYFGNYSGVGIEIKYAINSSTYDARRYYLINSTIDNSTDTIGLYNLDGTPITFTVLDETGSDVVNAYLDIRRFYASVNNYRTIAMAKTGDSGTASTYLDVKLCAGSTETFYAIDIYDNRSILIKSLPGQSFSDTDCDGIAEETLKITVGEEVYNYWTREEALSYSYDPTNDSNNVNATVSVVDTLGIVSTITLNCYRIRNIGNLLISSETSTGSSANLTCILGDVTDNSYIIQTLVTYPSIGDVTFTETIEPGVTYDFGGDGLMAGFFLLVALAVGYATTPVMSLIALIIGLIIIYSLELTLFSLDAIITLIFSIIFIIYIIGRKK